MQLETELCPIFEIELFRSCQHVRSYIYKFKLWNHLNEQGCSNLKFCCTKQVAESVLGNFDQKGKNRFTIEVVFYRPHSFFEHFTLTL